MGFKVVFEGEQAIIINRNGVVKKLQGPQRVRDEIK